ncbi:unnamed protein product [Rangifer tarandus platyrhynchus]|uniref:Uncharacterized protein n=1 Tax=Rangifer tarandus platyrhynchus TaxID=3082113 RepID=A0AC59Z1D3_RANTA
MTAGSDAPLSLVAGPLRQAAITRTCNFHGSSAQLVFAELQREPALEKEDSRAQHYGGEAVRSPHRCPAQLGSWR